MASIRHFPATHPLPDWRNLGVILRILLGANLLAALAALVRSPVLSRWPEHFMEMAALVEPVLLATVLLLAALRDALRRLPLRAAQALVLALAASAAAVLAAYWRTLTGDPSSLRDPVLAACAGALLLLYFELRARAFKPAQSEARLSALNARIRPHFLFNSLNAVLSLIRARPQEAENALESLSDLFRAAMRDPGDLISLADEIELCKQYLALEHLRLGERLRIDWQIEQADLNLPIPPLMLQPLLENAVYHGIEPSPDGGTVRIAIAGHDDEIRIRIRNPTAGRAAHAAGNQMALANIRERLALYYDLEARLEIAVDDQHYEVSIALPCRKTR